MSSPYQKRRLINRIGLTLAGAAMTLGLSFLVWILFTLLETGLGALRASLFVEMTPPPGSAGGLANAIYGSFLIVLTATLLGTPIGIMAGIYLAEFGRNTRIAAIVRFVNDILLSAPSIVIGLFVYTVYVARVGHFSGWAGSLALGLIVIPIVVRTTENMLLLVPDSMREAAAALGAAQWRVVATVSLQAARSGILTGVLLAVARISGETAPLLFTSLNNQFWNSNMDKPMANLPMVIFQFAMSPYENWQTLAWGGAALITLSVLALNIVARLLFRRQAPR